MRLFAVILFWGIALSIVAEIPESARSRAAVERHAPALQTALQAKTLQLGSPVFIRVFKRTGKLEVWIQNAAQTYSLFKIYDICYFSGNLGPKTKQGDMQSPEGFYYVTPGQLNPWSRFHLSFNLGYPNAYDRYHGRTGSALMVHGDCVSIGCYAMTDKKIEEIYTLVESALRNGQPFVRVHVFPFKLEDNKLLLYSGNKWLDFWKNLREGYQFFEEHKVPPNVEVVGGRYVFEFDEI